MTPYPARPIRPSRAFTLIELLTVIAIIGILAAIIIPTVGQVRQSARVSQSLSNARQIGLALATYASERRETWPAPVNAGAFWSKDALFPYLTGRIATTWPDVEDSVFISPLAPRLGEQDNPAAPAVANNSNRGFGYNAMLPPNEATYSAANQLPVLPGRIANPSRTMVLMDCNAPRVWAPAFRDQYTTFVRNRQNNRNVVLFADSHVELVSHDAIPASHFATPEGSLFWRGY